MQRCGMRRGKRCVRHHSSDQLSRSAAQTAGCAFASESAVEAHRGPRAQDPCGIISRFLPRKKLAWPFVARAGHAWPSPHYRSAREGILRSPLRRERGRGPVGPRPEWYSRRESNPDLRLRRPTFYPLNYRSTCRLPGRVAQCRTRTRSCKGEFRRRRTMRGPVSSRCASRRPRARAGRGAGRG